MAMFSKPKTKPVAAPAIHSLLGKGMFWKGEIHCNAHCLRIEGSVEGSIHSEGEVTVAPNGLVKGTIRAKHLIVTGRVEGVFNIQECLEVHGTGHVEGEMEFGSLVVDEGGIIQGHCTKRGSAKQEIPAPQSTTPTMPSGEAQEDGELVAVAEGAEGPTNGRKKNR